VEFGDHPPIATRLRHLLKFVDVMNLREFCACGTSHGALLAALMYFAEPARVTKLIINGSAACSSPDDKLSAHLSETLKKDNVDIGNSTLAEWRARCGRSLYDPKSVPAELPAILLTAYAQPWVQRAWKQSLLSFMDVGTMKQFRIAHRLAELQVDTLVVWGRQDRGAPHEDAVRMVSHMPRANLVTFEDCGHMPMLEHPEKYNDLVRTFLSHH
jgi:2-hydroxy-6-oxonona-2,4-dienedioate hydrolase